MYSNLTLITKGSTHYVDSRQVAELIGKRHDNLLRDIEKYRETMAKNGHLKIEESNFFILSSYRNTQNKLMPCYLLSKMGCEIVANKLTGEKGILFTVAYVTKFNAMEQLLQTEQNAELKKLRELVKLPTLSDFNETAKIVIAQLKRIGVTNDRIIYFLNNLYEPLGITISDKDDFTDIPCTYTAKQIAWIYGIYSLYGNPHAHAVSCIINENMFLNPKHKIPLAESYGGALPVSYRYDEQILKAVGEWLKDYKYPCEVYGTYCTYRVLYKTKKDD